MSFTCQVNEQYFWRQLARGAPVTCASQIVDIYIYSEG